MQSLKKEYHLTTGVSHHDNLSGLLNHGIFSLMLDQEIARSHRYGSQFSCALFGIDNFTQYNRTNGRVSGDLAIKSIGQTIKQEIRRSDIASRLCGDVFAVLYPETTIKDALGVTDRIRINVREKHASNLTLSAGILAGTDNINDETALIDLASEVLSQAKRLGKDTTHCYSDEVHVLPEKSSAHILLVDDEPKNLKLLEAMLIPMKHRITKVSNGMEALRLLQSSDTDIDIVLLDVMMPEMDGFEVCRRVRANPDTRLTPIILITALDDAESKFTGLEAGANDFITKPPNRAELMARTQSLIKLRQVTSKLTGIENVLFSLARSIEAKDPYTQGHAERVASLAVALGRRMNLSSEELEALRYAGFLHDIGKIGTPRSILNKPGKLDDEEFKVVQSHPVVGHSIVMPLQQILGRAVDAIRHHHERLDGSGYPDKLVEAQIPLNARIMAVADVYDALTTDRPYRTQMPKEKAISIIRNDCAAGKLDKHIVDLLIEEVDT